ncbi:MAG: M23 family metallopeptidase [Chitinophagaceae bacterium]
MSIKNIIIAVVLIAASFACNTPISKIFEKKQTPHEAYADRIKHDSMRNEWINVSKSSLLHALPVTIPYQHKGIFPDDKLRALTLEFNALRGERLTVTIINTDTTTGVIFADLFKKDSSSLSHLIAADTSSGIFIFEVEENGSILLRLQPTMTIIENYQLQITKGPSLVFPLTGSRNIGSRWGDARDGGVRSHEGIDIPAPRGTPAIAAAEGVISRVQEGGLGGKTVSIRTRERNLSLYYAHLDSQLVTQGQRVNAGDTIGLVGNTGNAITTGPHLHFGIYTGGGALDPYPFVNKNVKAALALPTTILPKKLELLTSVSITETEKLAAKTILLPLAISSEGFLAETATGIIIKVSAKSVKRLNK